MRFQRGTDHCWKPSLASTAGAKTTAIQAERGKLLLEIFPWLD